MNSISRDTRRRSPSLAYRHGLQINEGKVCNASGCLTHRHHLDGYCKAHLTAALRYGHPKGKHIKRACWVPYRKLIEALYNRNESHPGFIEGLRVVGDYMARGASQLDAFPGAPEMRRLCAAGVDARAVLIELCACSMYLEGVPSATPDDRSADFALSRAILALAPRPRRTSWVSGQPKSYGTKANRSALMGIGAAFRKALAPLLVQTRLGVEAMQVAKATTADQLEAARRAPFVAL